MMVPAQHKSEFITVNGIRLHFLDWGGSGPVLLFVAGMGCTAYIFDQLAPRFTDHFRVLAITRRGHGDSDAPETGYDADTLAEDLRQFLDALNGDPVFLVGHSMGYVELSRFARLYPKRTRKLVFLDAAYDHTDLEVHEVSRKNPLSQLVPAWPEEGLTSIEEYIATDRRLNPALDAIWGPVMEQEIRHRLKRNPAGIIEERMPEVVMSACYATMASYQPNYKQIQAPLLCFFAIQDGADYLSPEFMREEQQAEVLKFFQTDGEAYIRKYIQQFRRDVPRAKIVEIPHGHHYCFLKQEDLVFDEMLAFLLDGLPA